MDDKLFSEYQTIRGRLEWLIEKTSRDEVMDMLEEDFPREA